MLRNERRGRITAKPGAPGAKPRHEPIHSITKRAKVRARKEILAYGENQRRSSARFGDQLVREMPVANSGMR